MCVQSLRLILQFILLFIDWLILSLSLLKKSEMFVSVTCMWTVFRSLGAFFKSSYSTHSEYVIWTARPLAPSVEQTTDWVSLMSKSALKLWFLNNIWKALAFMNKKCGMWVRLICVKLSQIFTTRLPFEALTSYLTQSVDRSNMFSPNS